jgi:hypothetical protein
MAVLDDYITRRWLMAMAVIVFVLQVLISQSISLFIPSGEIVQAVKSPGERLFNFEISKETYSSGVSYVANSSNLFHSDKKYIFALIFCHSLLSLLFLGRRWKWAHYLPILQFPGGFTNSLEGLIFGGVTNWIIIPFEKVWFSCSLGDIFIYFGVVWHWIVIVKIETIRYKCRRQQSDALNSHNLKIPDSVDERL